MSEDLEPIEKVENPCQVFYLQSSSGKVYRCYRTSEADEVIAELKAQKVQAEDDCAYWKSKYKECKRELDLLKDTTAFYRGGNE